MEEELPSNMPTPRGMGFVMRAFVDADHAGDSIICISRTDLCGMRGGSEVPLSYVVRKSNELHPNTEVDDPVTSYTTTDADMFKRAPIITEGNPLGTEEDGPFDDSFVADRGKV